MLLWLSKNSEVSVREQLVAQIMLGVASGDLKPGERLPSTRELGRRYSIHSNTVSAAYRELERLGWLESKRGSGVYVRAHAPEDVEADPSLALDQIISAFLMRARSSGFSLAEIQARVKHWLQLQPPDHFVVVEPDAELRKILVAEIEEATNFRVRGIGIEACADESNLMGASVVALHSQADRVRAALPAATGVLWLHSRSIPESLRGERLPPPDALISVVSRWADFLNFARVILVAAGVDPAALNFRDARERRWERGLRASAFVITDTVAAREIARSCQMRIFRIIADSSLEDLRSYVKQFLSHYRSANLVTKQ